MWVIAALVITQTPAMLAVKNGPSHNAHIDNELAHIEADGTAVTLDVIVRVESRSDWASVLAALNSQGFKVGRPSPRSNALAVTIPSSALAWLGSLPGVASISVDGEVATAPLSPEAFLTSSGFSLLGKTTLRAQLGLTDFSPDRQRHRRRHR